MITTTGNTVRKNVPETYYRPPHWSDPLMQALELASPPERIEVDGRWFNFKIKDGVRRYELANDRKTR